MEKGFPLLRLPYVALKHAVLQMSLQDIIHFSFCSPASKHVVKSIFNQKYIVEVAVFLEKKEPDLLIDASEVYGTSAQSVFNREHRFYLREDEMTANYFYLNQIQGNSIDNQVNMVQKWSDYICDIFNTNIDYLSIKSTRFLKDIVNWIGNRQETVPSVSLEDESIQNDDLEYFLDNINAKERLDFRVKPQENFNYQKSFNQKMIYIRDAEWITLSFVQKLINSTHIQLKHSNWTNKDLKGFLNNWVQGDLPNLVCFSVEVKHMNWLEVTSGLDLTRWDNSILYYYTCAVGTKDFMFRGDELKKADGSEAVLNYHLPFVGSRHTNIGFTIIAKSILHPFLGDTKGF